MIDKSLRFEFIRLRIAFLVKVDCKPTNHDNRIFRNKISFIFVVFGVHMNHPRFRNGPVAHDFFDDGANVGKIIFIVPVWRSFLADYSVEFFVGFFDYFGVEGKLKHQLVQCDSCCICPRLSISNLTQQWETPSIIVPLI